QLVAAHHPERLGRLVLTPSDAYENFMPPAFRPLQVLAHVPGSVLAIASSLRAAPLRRLPLAYGWVTKRADAALTRSWIEPALSSREIRHEIAEILKGIDKRYTLQAAERCGDLGKPVLTAWAPEARSLTLRDGDA